MINPFKAFFKDWEANFSNPNYVTQPPLSQLTYKAERLKSRVLNYYEEIMNSSILEDRVKTYTKVYEHALTIPDFLWERVASATDNDFLNFQSAESQIYQWSVYHNGQLNRLIKE